MIELIIFIVIVGVAVVGILQVLTLNTRSSADPARRKQAMAIAEGLMEEVRQAAFTWCDFSDPHFDHLLDQIGTSSIVLLGESTHGTTEFYRLRTEITKRLVVERGFDAIAVECDWPDALRVSRYVQHSDGDINAVGALGGYQRFPQWMWRNTEVVALVEWLRAHNAQAGDPVRRVGFYGLDLYSLRKSMHAVIEYLDKEDPAAARRARERYACIDHMADYPQRYGYAATFGMTRDCEDELVGQLRELSLQAARLMARPGAAVPDQLFYAQQNARVARNAETYYRAMFQHGDAAWNVRFHEVASNYDAAGAEKNGQGLLIPNVAMGLSAAAGEKRESMAARVAKVAEIIAEDPDDHY
eukprot:gene31805-39287_t